MTGLVTWANGEWIADEIGAIVKKLRFYIGRFLMLLGMQIMPFEADASIKYNVNFLSLE